MKYIYHPLYLFGGLCFLILQYILIFKDIDTLDKYSSYVAASLSAIVLPLVVYQLILQKRAQDTDNIISIYRYIKDTWENYKKHSSINPYNENDSLSRFYIYDVINCYENITNLIGEEKISKSTIKYFEEYVDHTLNRMLDHSDIYSALLEDVKNYRNDGYRNTVDGLSKPKNFDNIIKYLKNKKGRFPNHSNKIDELSSLLQ